MIFTIVVLCVLNTLFAPNSDGAVIQTYGKKSKVRTIVEEKCHAANVVDEQTIDNLMIAAHNTYECLTNNTGTPRPNTVIDFDEFCTYYTQAINYKCLSDFFDAAKPCFTRHEQYIPDLILGGVNKTKSNLCDPANKQKLEEIRRTVLSYGNNPHIGNDKKVAKCGRRRSLFINQVTEVQVTNLIILKEDLCSDISKIYDCVLQLLTGNTGNDYKAITDIYLGGYLQTCD